MARPALRLRDIQILEVCADKAFPPRVLVRSNQKLGCCEVCTIRRHLYPTRASGNKTKIRCYRARSADLSNSKRSANKSPDKNARQLSLLHLTNNILADRRTVY